MDEDQNQNPQDQAQDAGQLPAQNQSAPDAGVSGDAPVANAPVEDVGDSSVAPAADASAPADDAGQDGSGDQPAAV